MSHVHPTVAGPTSKPIESIASPGRHIHGTAFGPTSLDEEAPEGDHHTHIMPNGWRLDRPVAVEAAAE